MYRVVIDYGTRRGGFRRQGKGTIDEVLNDYEEVSL